MMTAVVILSTGHHLCLNSGSNSWEVFRMSLLQTVIDHLIGADEPGAHVICARIAHNDHFHAIDSQVEFFTAMSATGAVREPVASEGSSNNSARGRTCH